MMQWLDRLCRYGTFGEKSLKTELRLKSYRVFNFQGLKRKITELKIGLLLKLGTKF
jgi:hypothetical protein